MAGARIVRGERDKPPNADALRRAERAYASAMTAVRAVFVGPELARDAMIVDDAGKARPVRFAGAITSIAEALAIYLVCTHCNVPKRHLAAARGVANAVQIRRAIEGVAYWRDSAPMIDEALTRAAAAVSVDP